ncbi:MAG: hypothetical protein AUF67_05865 [Acidobacteria bacterium 13_1_20CM_58_21]|nr:MAG: hypothetical protein AUF67_05865 [Acidobacteria bacterium 13_1_20CM_58_21]
MSQVPPLSQEGTAVSRSRLERIFGRRMHSLGLGREITGGRKKSHDDHDDHDDHWYGSEISRKMIPFGMGIGETEGVAMAGGGLFSEEHAAKSKPLKFWKPRVTNCRKVAFPNVLLDTIASSMIRVCTFRLTRGTP